MADAFTPNFNFTKPEVGFSDDTWGNKNNGNWDTVDTQLKAVKTTADAALPKAGGTMTGDILLKGAPTNDLHPATKAYVDGLVGPVAGVPTGKIGEFAGTTAPSGWLKANGAAVSRTTYAALYAYIGVTYGAGDGSTTFNLPDYRGVFRRGLDEGRGVDAGRSIATQQAANVGTHTHTASLAVTGTTSTDGAHTHNIAALNSGSNTGGGQPFAGPNGGTVTSSAGAHSHTVSGTAAGTTDNGSATGETRPINMAVLVCIKY